MMTPDDKIFLFFMQFSDRRRQQVSMIVHFVQGRREAVVFENAGLKYNRYRF